jgi:hypothetical protein
VVSDTGHKLICWPGGERDRRSSQERWANALS